MKFQEFKKQVHNTRYQLSTILVLQEVDTNTVKTVVCNYDKKYNSGIKCLLRRAKEYSKGYKKAVNNTTTTYIFTI